MGTMRIAIICDNEVLEEGPRPDWGFFCLVELEGVPGILSDTGADGSILLQNMDKLGADLGVEGLGSMPTPLHKVQVGNTGEVSREIVGLWSGQNIGV